MVKDNYEKKLNDQIAKINFYSLLLEIIKFSIKTEKNEKNDEDELEIKIKKFLAENFSELLIYSKKIPLFILEPDIFSPKEKEEMIDTVSVIIFLSKEILGIDLFYLLEIIQFEGGKVII